MVMRISRCSVLLAVTVAPSTKLRCGSGLGKPASQWAAVTSSYPHTYLAAWNIVVQKIGRRAGRSPGLCAQRAGLVHPDRPPHGISGTGSGAQEDPRDRIIPPNHS